MRQQEIFERLAAMRQAIDSETKEPMSDRDNALLWDVAKALNFNDDQAAILAGDVDVTDSQLTPQPTDFDKGFGIGGLGRHVENIPMPSRGALEREERLARTDVVCRRCGKSNHGQGTKPKHTAP